ncbi:MAG: lipid-A-disaccharide synthase N-terminal domain-containing protein [Methylomonas sp.]|nr:lipid-A-disaccharide synthase N-terminal domain-containing protein [Methylomonas sp.]PPD19923.1 MAG: lipid A biosynthesis protein [Methylomonas sp.]PPD25480.1 MAG: lipid A biosynthesis protein [Methylomonas sp.]PPD36180.1 MAG: lipid A biosynthesis protein [Methylomonas sp.]PPD39709.1 MAG: lipid A biosynthesis protein [Methylomonas sp.]
MSDDLIWLVVGFAGQALFSARFLVQWLASERRKESVIPVMFWYFSLLGGSTLLVYSIHKHDPVFIVGQAMGLLIYARNLYFVVRSKPNPARAVKS